MRGLIGLLHSELWCFKGFFQYLRNLFCEKLFQYGSVWLERNIFLIYVSSHVEPYRSRILSWNIKITSFAKIHVTRPIWLADGRERLGVPRNEQDEPETVVKMLIGILRIERYRSLIFIWNIKISKFCKKLCNLLNMAQRCKKSPRKIRITQRIHLSRGRAERRARNVSHLDRPGASSVRITH